MSELKDKVLIAIATYPQKDNFDFFKSLIEQKIIACVNIIEKAKSIYIYNNKLCEDTECFAVLKLKNSNKQRLKDAFINSHPYEVPELLFLEVTDGLESYLGFIRG